MTKKYNLSLYIFRRDLRVCDNTALNQALLASKKVIPCFIFDPRQIKDNKYKSDNAIQFMITSLKELETQLSKKKASLYYFHGQAEDIVNKLITQQNIDALYINTDYTPFSKQRDSKIKRLCGSKNVSVLSFHDLLLHNPAILRKKSSEPYTVFTPYYNNALTYEVTLPKKIRADNFYTKTIAGSTFSIPQNVSWTKNDYIYVQGGRKEAKKLLKNLTSLKKYNATRDFPSIETSKLSAHHKFGTISIREVYYQIAKNLGENHPLIRQLYWRDFYTQIAYYFPYVFGKPFRKKYSKIVWSKSRKKFQAWCDGQTGFPIIDAGMRQLNTTGYMHNRVRMLVGSFLVKDLHIDWRWGEKYFAQKLVDYDPAVNNGNWQWVSSTGCDATPYFRIFNPWTQQKKFDPDAIYIKQWIPELKNIPAKEIHALNKKEVTFIENYPNPIIDHALERVKTLDAFKRM